MSSQEISEEDRQTLFVAGISKDVDEEILYELFLNVRYFLVFTIHHYFNFVQLFNFHRRVHCIK